MNNQNNGESTSTGMEQVWDTYHSTTFNAVNNLNKEEFESISKYYHHIYGKLLPADKMLKILDMGCGAGHFLYYLDKMGYKNYNGIDISLDQVEFVKTNITEKVEIVDAFNYLGDVEGEYDLIVCNDLIEHIRKERLIEIVELIYGALKPNGMVILKTPNMSAPFASISRYIDITHEIGFTEESLTQLLKIGGFQRIDIYPKIGDNGIKRHLSWVVLKLMYRICGRIPPNVLAPNLIELGFK